MAINPPSDIVLDVARAADPLQYNAAVAKLANIAGLEAPDDAFDLLLDSIDDPAFASVEAEVIDWTRADLRTRLEPLGLDTSDPTAANAQAAPYKQFEAFVLQTFIQSMFPKDADHVFGGGIAGSYWSSILAEQIAGQVAESGGIGIADELAAHDTGAAPRPDFSLGAILSGRSPGVTPRAIDAPGEV